MNAGNIVGLRADQDEVRDEPHEIYEDAAEEAPPARGLPILFAVVALLWIAFVIYAVITQRADLAQVVVGICLACAPLALLGIGALLLLRTSRREAARFLTTAQGMRSESARLERQLAGFTARIDANRQALSDQALQLAQIGDEAAARLGAVVTSFRQDGEALDRHADTLTRSAGSASTELSTLIAALPQAQQQSDGIAASLSQAGDAVRAQALALETQLKSLGAHGHDADAIAAGAADRLAEQIARIAEATDAARAMADQSAAALDAAGGSAADRLAARIGEIGALVDTLGRNIAAHDETGRALVDRMSGGMAEVEQRLERLDQSGTARTEQLSTAMAGLGEHADKLSASLSQAGDAADSFIGRAEGLLTALDASAREIDETLPAALARLDGFSAASRERIGTMLPGIGAVETSATAALDRLAQTEKLLQQQREAIELFGQAADRQLQAGKRSASELTTVVDTAQAHLAAISDSSGPQLIDVMLRVRDAANQAAERARETFARIVPQAAASIGHATEKAIEDVVSARVEKQVLAVAEAAEHAVSAANAAAAMLQDQLTGVSDGASALEARIEAVREQSDAANRDSFSRRASLLMESLNSTAIDVAKILSNDVTDSAWAAYLKGDRGVFTRRAVRLLEAGESKAILTYYESDPEFREQVGRYIHDFEAMLRNVLATREGSQIAVTLLSSDMGKLYVALAQAIERLRS